MGESAVGPERQAQVTDSQGTQVGDAGTQHNTIVNIHPGQQGVPSPGLPMAGTVVAGEIPQEPAAFQPRPELTAELRGVGPGVSVVRAVTGMRGVGKTQVAAAYARECVDVGWRLVAWLDAGDMARVSAGLATVAARLGIADADEEAGNAARAVRSWLEADGRSCLVVFDNVADLGPLRPFLPAVGKSRIVVTTTGQMAAGPGSVVPVGVFSEEEALAYLADRTGLPGDATAREVAAEVGWLPLALAQAGAVIAAQRLSYAVYLERLRSVPVREYLVPGPGEPYSRGMAEAVLLSLEAVAGADPGGICRAVMDVMALLSPSGVSRSLLYAAGLAGLLPGCADGGVGARLVDEALGQLSEGALLFFSVDGSSVSSHRLVMRVIREAGTRAGTQAALGAGVCGLLGTVTRSLGEPWRERAAAHDVIQQVTALHEHLMPCLDDTNRPLAVDLLSLRNWMLHCMNELGAPPGETVDHGRALTADCARLLGSDHPDTLTARNNLAMAYRAAGRTAEAIPLLEHTRTSRQRLLGTTHPDTLTTRNNLALAYQDAGRTAEAIPLLSDTLADRRRMLGDDHPDTLTSQDNLAMAYRAAGRTAEAIPLLEHTRTSRQRLLGTTHRDTLTTRNNLALAYWDAGRTIEAIPLLEHTLADCQRLLGTNHPETLSSQNSLALAYQDAGRTAEAVPLLEHTLAGRRRMLGDDHPDTLTTRNNLATAYRAAGKTAEAIPLLEHTLADFGRLLGTDHPDTLTTRNNLATAYRAAGRTAEAIPLLEHTLATRVRLLGDDHPSTLTSRNNLAMAYWATDRTAEAIPLLERALADFARLRGTDHPSTLTSRNNLAMAYWAMGRTAEAIPLLEHTLADRARLLGADHPDTNVTRRNLEALTDKPTEGPS